MTFKRLSGYFQQLETTASRLSMTEILASLFKEAGNDEIDLICYLLQGRVAPLYEAIEFGVAERMAIRAIAQGMGIDQERTTKAFKDSGDLGNTVEKIKNDEFPKAIYHPLQINYIFNVLYELALASGEGSQEEKINLLGDLLKEADPLSARFIVRIPLNKLRLGFSDMTILDSLSWMLTGTKEHRKQIEKAYNVRPDLGFISKAIKDKGIKGLADVSPRVGTPILMARAERMTNSEDIIDKIGTCAIEPKYDGFRLQIHYDKFNDKRLQKKDVDKNLILFDESDKSFVRLFSRNLENVTPMYPDIVEGVVKQLQAKEAILEGEAIAYDPENGSYLPFQETVVRKRKYDIREKAKEVPLRLFAFDLLYVDGENYLEKQYVDRRKKLEKIVAPGKTILISEEEVVVKSKRLEEIFKNALKRGLEGVMAKKLEGNYQAGSRDFNWIKYKKSYAGKVADTIDLVIMGYDFGQGKRTDFGIGGFLTGVYDQKKEKFVTMAKIGTGLSDEEWRSLKEHSQKLKVKNKPSEYEVDKMMQCDVWLNPSLVVEIRADEITRSPVHTAGRVMQASKSGNSEEISTPGFALRFPRLERFRKDKGPTDITTVAEIEKMYKLQEK